MKRVLALVAAVAMVAGALAVRSALDGDQGGGDGEASTVVCTPELAPVCQAVAADGGVEVRIEDYATTFSALTAGDAPDDVDAWLAPAPVAGMVTDERARQGLAPVLGDPGEPLARSPLVLVGWRDRLAPLGDHCGGDVTWACIGSAADVAWDELGGSPTWGALKPGHASPGGSAEGLLVVAQASGSQLDTTDYASNDFAEPGFRPWFEQLEQTVAGLQSGAGEPLDRMLSQGVAAYDVVGATEAESAPAVARSRDRDRLEVRVPTPAATVDLAVVPVLDAPGAQRAVDALRGPTAAEALAEAGWRVPGQALAPGLDAGLELPTDDGLPAPGVLLALRSLWQEVT